MSCDESSLKHNKQTSSSELRTKTVFFMHQSSTLFAKINDGRPSFLLWLRLRLLVVFGEGIWGCRRCNSAMDFFWVVKLLRLHNAQLWIVFSFKFRSLALCNYISLVSLFLLCELGVELYTWDLVKFVRHRLFWDIFFKMAGLGLASEDFHALTVLWLRIFIHRDRVELLNCFVWNYREPGNIYLDGYEFVVVWFSWVFVCLCFAGLTRHDTDLCGSWVDPEVKTPK